MSIGYRASIPEQHKYFILTVKSCDKGELSGFLYHELYSGGIRYTGVMELIRLVEDLAKSAGYPVRTVMERSFLEEETAFDREALMAGVENRSRMRNSLASFRLRLMYRYRSTWQGICENVNTGEKREFESFLELLKMIEEVLNLSEAQTLLTRLADGNEKQLLWLADGTFAVRVLFRRNESLQGVLYWLDRKRQVNFRSYLELLKLLDEACAAGRKEKRVLRPDESSKAFAE